MEDEEREKVVLDTFFSFADVRRRWTCIYMFDMGLRLRSRLTCFPRRKTTPLCSTSFLKEGRKEGTDKSGHPASNMHHNVPLGRLDRAMFACSVCVLFCPVSLFDFVHSLSRLRYSPPLRLRTKKKETRILFPFPLFLSRALYRSDWTNTTDKKENKHPTLPISKHAFDVGTGFNRPQTDRQTDRKRTSERARRRT